MFALLFVLAFFIVGGKTYFILCIAALLNMAVYPFTSEYSVVLESSLDVITLLLIIRLGDRHYWYQIGLLLVAMFSHLLFEVDQRYSTDFIFSNYETAIITITVLQLFGGVYGGYQLVKRLLWNNRNTGLSHRLYSRVVIEEKTWPKE